MAQFSSLGASTRAASAHPAAASTSAPERELKVHISTDSFVGYWAYEGTRAQLEAEGVIPAGAAWPQGKRELEWSQGRLRFCLRRTRPEGMKGPMSAWTSGDWWRLRCDTAEDISFADWTIQKKMKELVRAIQAYSPAGIQASHLHSKRYWVAREDRAFQAFLAALLPVAAGVAGRAIVSTKKRAVL